jgi:hypothetical protein
MGDGFQVLGAGIDEPWIVAGREGILAQPEVRLEHARS